MKRIKQLIGKLLFGISILINQLISEYKLSRIHHGENVIVNGKVEMAHMENIHIDSNTYVNGGMIHASPNASIRIGKNCLISYGVHLRTDTHCYKDKNQLIRKQGHHEADIVIEDDVWLGYGAQVLPGVTIKRGAVIGAGAVVTKDVREFAIVAGVPAKEIKHRL